MASGIIYILVNPALKGLLKIGKTVRTAEERASELSRETGVPTRFLVAYEDQVSDCGKAEALIHARLAAHRYQKGREFFHMQLKDALPIVMKTIEEVNNQFPKADDESSDVITADSNEITPWLPIAIQRVPGWSAKILWIAQPFREGQNIVITDRNLRIMNRTYRYRDINAVQVIAEEQRYRPPGKMRKVSKQVFVLQLSSQRRLIKALRSDERKPLMDIFHQLTTVGD